MSNRQGIPNFIPSRWK